MWTASYVLSLAATGTVSADTIYGSSSIEKFDGLGAPSGTEDLIFGGGGSDTFVYQINYGHLRILENNYGSGAAQLQLGTGLTRPTFMS